MPHSNYNSKREIKSKVITSSVKKSSTSAGMMKSHGGKVHVKSQHISRGSF